MIFRRLLDDRAGGSAAEFALVLPLLILFLFGIIDAGRWMWINNRGEKAAQMGARMAVVTSPVSSAVTDNYVGACSPALTQGDLIPASCFSTVTCTDSTCSSGTADQVAFRRIVDRMHAFFPDIQYSNVTLKYSSAGLGYAGNPNGPDLSPLVTVEVSGLVFTPISGLMLVNAPLPNFSTSLTAEDSVGTQSN